MIITRPETSTLPLPRAINFSICSAERRMSSTTNPWKEIKRRLLEFADPAQQLVSAGSLDWNFKKRQPKQPHSDGPPAKKLRLTIHHSVDVPDGYCDDSDEDGCEEKCEETGLDEHGASCDNPCPGVEDVGVDSCSSRVGLGFRG